MRIMDTILKPEEVTEIDGRQYLNPQAGLDESNRFIDNLRSTQAQQNQQIATDTFNLGTNIASSQGGLGTNTPANMGYFTSRLQTPQTNSAVANLRSAAQAQALNQALQNEQEIWKKKYQDAYRNYQKRMYDKANTPTTTQDPGTPDNVSTGDTTQEITSVETEGLAKSRYQALLMKYLQAGYPVDQAEARAKEDFGKSVDVNAPVEPYGGQ